MRLDPEDLEALPSPCVLVDLDRVEANLATMAAATAGHGVALRPHIKTHKIPELALAQTRAGAVGITCATVREVDVMLGTGITAITLAYPVVSDAVARRVAGWREQASIRVHLDSVESARVLGRRSAAEPLEVLVEVDTGHHRLGAPPGEPARNLARAIDDTPGVRVVGLASHAGHAYRCRTAEEIEAVAAAEAEALLESAALLQHDGIEASVLSVGSTPSTLPGLGSGITETRPGTYALNDATMVRLGAATLETCAMHVVATVISRPSATRLVLDAGTKILTSDGVGQPDWIRVPDHPGLHPEFLSEEHGVFRLDPGATSPAIGERALVLPSHACPVMNLVDSVHVLADGRLAGQLQVAARGR